jgi:hypothetical protein
LRKIVADSIQYDPYKESAVTTPSSGETTHRYPGLVLATLAIANVMALLDLFVVNVALHDIAVSLHHESSLSDVAWVLNATLSSSVRF